MLFADLKPGEALVVAGVKITFLRKSGKTARLAIDGDRKIPVQRLSADENKHYDGE